MELPFCIGFTILVLQNELGSSNIKATASASEPYATIIHSYSDKLVHVARHFLIQGETCSYWKRFVHIERDFFIWYRLVHIGNIENDLFILEETCLFWKILVRDLLSIIKNLYNIKYIC